MARFSKDFGASGDGHAPGDVPDPGAVAGSARFLREDGDFALVPDFVIAGTGHAAGLVPDPGATPDTASFLSKQGWATVTSESGGTVRSVALHLPAELTVTGSPITDSGTLSAAWAAENANTAFMGPSGGARDVPGFRPLVPDDIASGGAPGDVVAIADDDTLTWLTPEGLVVVLVATSVSISADVDVVICAPTSANIAVALPLASTATKHVMLYKSTNNARLVTINTTSPDGSLQAQGDQTLAAQGDFMLCWPGATSEISPGAHGWFMTGRLPDRTPYVQSVSLSLPAQFSTSGSSGTTIRALVASWVAQAANKALYGPASGAAAAPTFRSPVPADLAAGGASTNVLAQVSGALAWAAATAGPTGATGQPGGGVTIPYTFNSTTGADSGSLTSATLRADNATLLSATRLFISNTDSAGGVWTALVTTLAASTSTNKGTIRVTKQADSTHWVLFTLTGATNHTGYEELTVSYVAGSTGPQFVASDALWFFYDRTGDKGATGATGATGPAGADGVSPPADPAGYDSFGAEPSNALLGSTVKAYQGDSGSYPNYDSGAGFLGFRALAFDDSTWAEAVINWPIVYGILGGGPGVGYTPPVQGQSNGIGATTTPVSVTNDTLITIDRRTIPIRTNYSAIVLYLWTDPKEGLRAFINANEIDFLGGGGYTVIESFSGGLPVWEVHIPTTVLDGQAQVVLAFTTRWNGSTPSVPMTVAYRLLMVWGNGGVEGPRGESGATGATGAAGNSIVTTTLAGGAATIDFTSIPATGTLLRFRGMVRSSFIAGSAPIAWWLTFNGLTSTSYSSTGKSLGETTGGPQPDFITGAVSNILLSDPTIDSATFRPHGLAADGHPERFTRFTIEVPYYAATSPGNAKHCSGVVAGLADTESYDDAGLLFTANCHDSAILTAAINRVTFSVESGFFDAGSKITLEVVP